MVAKGMPVMTTARPARSEKSRPSLTLPLQQRVAFLELCHAGCTPARQWHRLKRDLDMDLDMDTRLSLAVTVPKKCNIAHMDNTR